MGRRHRRNDRQHGLSGHWQLHVKRPVLEFRLVDLLEDAGCRLREPCWYHGAAGEAIDEAMHASALKRLIFISPMGIYHVQKNKA
jgi:hypothetical protein